jgi:hypothetical protein
VLFWWKFKGFIIDSIRFVGESLNRVFVVVFTLLLFIRKQEWRWGLSWRNRRACSCRKTSEPELRASKSGEEKLEIFYLILHSHRNMEMYFKTLSLRDFYCYCKVTFKGNFQPTDNSQRQPFLGVHLGSEELLVSYIWEVLYVTGLYLFVKEFDNQDNRI